MMSDGQPKRSITRRTAVKSMITAVAGAAVTSSAKAADDGRQTASRAKLAKPSGAKRIELQPTGSEIWQIETQLRYSHTYASIYGERSWCSADSRYFVYLRQNEYLWSRNNHEYMLVELGTWRRRRLDVSTGRRGVAISHSGVFYYLKHFADDDTVYLMRANLDDPRPEKLVPIRRFMLTLGTATTDGRYYAYGTVLDPTWKRFGQKV